MAPTSKFIDGKKNIFVRVDVSAIFQAKISLDVSILASSHYSVAIGQTFCRHQKFGACIAVSNAGMKNLVRA